jgi:beta-galactosidase
VLYITGRRFTERTNAVTNVKIYSNAAQVELFLNGASLNTCTNDGNAVFVWRGVTLVPGDNKIEARAERAGRAMTDSCQWTLKSF